MPTGIYKHKRGWEHTEETKKKISQAKLGKPSKLKNKSRPEETKKKMRKSHRRLQESYPTKARFGKCNGRYGKGEIVSGEKNGRWLGGKSFEPYSINWTETLKRAIKERDKYICQICNSYGNVVHHIDYNKKNCNLENLITLCKKCHSKTNTKRDYWIKYLQQ